MKISELKEPYKSLAELRRKECGFKEIGHIVESAFCWDDTSEGYSFWLDVSKGKNPLIPKSKFITVRENMMNEIRESEHDLISLSIELDLKYGLFKYSQGDESALNGEEIQRIFDYLKR